MSTTNNQFELKCLDKMLVNKLRYAIVQQNKVTNFSLQFSNVLTIDIKMGLKDSTLKYKTDLKAHGIATELVDEFKKETDPNIPPGHIFNTPPGIKRPQKQVTPEKLKQIMKDLKIRKQEYSLNK